MARFSGKVGYSQTVESPVGSGVYEDQIIEKQYFGDVLRNTRQTSERDKVLDNLTVSNSISVIADAYAYLNFFAIRYVEWMGQRWVVTDVDVQRPRLIFTLGRIYNGPTPE
jgi:hypothetical protein